MKIQVETDDAVMGLREVNKLINSIRLLEANDFFFEDCDDALFWRLGNVSDEIKNNPELMNFIKSVLSVEENFRHRKVAIENKKIVDLNTNAYTSTMDITKIKSKILSLIDGGTDINYGIIHVIGSIPVNEKQAIIDAIKNKLYNCELKSVFTNKELLGKTVVEAVLFGQFEPETFF